MFAVQCTLSHCKL